MGLTKRIDQSGHDLHQNSTNAVVEVARTLGHNRADMVTDDVRENGHDDCLWVARDLGQRGLQLLDVADRHELEL